MTIESSATPDGKIACELIKEFWYGSDVYSVHVYKTCNGTEYEEIGKSYPIGNKRKAKTIYKQYKNRYLRNKD